MLFRKAILPETPDSELVFTASSALYVSTLVGIVHRQQSRPCNALVHYFRLKTTA